MSQTELGPFPTSAPNHSCSDLKHRIHSREKRRSNKISEFALLFSTSLALLKNLPWFPTSPRMLYYVCFFKVKQMHTICRRLFFPVLFLGFLSTLFRSLHCAIPTLMSAQAVSSSRLELGSQHPSEVFEDRPFGELGSREEQKVALGLGMGEVGNGRQETSEHVLGVSHINHFYSTQ